MIITNSASDIARNDKVSDYYVRYTFMNSVISNRLPLPKYLCIDEGHLNTDANHKYLLILLNFVSKDVVDTVISRKEIVHEIIRYQFQSQKEIT